MSGIAKNFQSDLTHLCQKAESLGASKAVAVPVADIVVDERALLKCMVPLCSHYGVDLVCPPNVLPVSKFNELLKSYHSAILIKVDIPLNNLSGSSARKRKKTETSKAEMTVYREAQKRLHEVVSRVESLCMEEGHHFAAGLIGGACPLCEECVGIRSDLPCRHPFKARPAMEAMGIDVIATAKKAGMHLSFSQGEDRSWIVLVLVD